jgi:hypothetical protein
LQVFIGGAEASEILTIINRGKFLEKKRIMQEMAEALGVAW